MTTLDELRDLVEVSESGMWVDGLDSDDQPTGHQFWQRTLTFSISVDGNEYSHSMTIPPIVETTPEILTHFTQDQVTQVARYMMGILNEWNGTR